VHSRQSLKCRGSTGIRHLGQQNQSTAAFHQRRHGRTIAGTLDQIGFPVPWNQTIFYFFWLALVNADHAGQAAASIVALAAFTATIVLLAQATDQFIA